MLRRYNRLLVASYVVSDAVLGIVAFGLADEILTLWLATRFEGGRHQRRLDQITAAERA